MHYKADTVICHCNNVDYKSIRQAMVAGARTEEDILRKTGAGGSCGRCKSQVQDILASVCGCNGVSLETVLKSVKKGANTVERVSEETHAGSCCGRCKPLIQNVIDIQK
ncbi:MAG: (2Fe-2S)-binding protein [Bacteroidales bacterium]